ncbi:MAG: iron-sulfur cluster assembly scaffold protein [Chloroflexota bacterium]
MTLLPESQPMLDITEASGAQGSLDTLYNPVVVDHIAHPRNLGVLENATGTGLVDDSESENLIVMYVRVEADCILAASFRALACSACIAASSITTCLLPGRSASAAPLTGLDVLTALGGLPESKLHCAELAARAANLALASHGAAVTVQR